nr:uncharacterized protein LOC119172930 [Rhipicephalus microplus]
MAPSRATLRVLPPPPVFAYVVSAVLVLAFALTTTPALVSGYLQDDETPEEVLGLAGGEVSLPCGSSQFPGLAEDDEPILVLWFREGSATPILSADARRGGGLANAKCLVCISEDICVAAGPDIYNENAGGLRAVEYIPLRHDACSSQ